MTSSTLDDDALTPAWYKPKEIVLNEKFKSIDERFDEVDKRFDEVDKRFDEIDRRFDDIGDQFAAQIEYIDQSINTAINAAINHYSAIVMEHFDSQVALMYESMGITIDNKLGPIHQELHEHDRRLLNLEAT